METVSLELRQGLRTEKVTSPRVTTWVFTVGRNQELSWRLFKGSNDKLGPDSW